MPIELPPHVAGLLGLAGPQDLQAISTSVDANGDQIDTLRSPEAKAYFIAEVQNLPANYQIEVNTPVSPVAEWRTRKIEFDGIECARAVEVPSTLIDGNLQVQLPPTDAEPLLVRTWLMSDRLTDSTGQFQKNTVIVEWLPGVSEGTKEVVRSICGVAFQPGIGTSHRIWTDATIIEVRSESRLVSHKDGVLLRRLFNEACTEFPPRWRFLSMYRILEHGYLENIFDEFSRRFFTEPKEASESIANALKSEVEQFIRLVDSNNLKVAFEEIEKINNGLLATNQFAILIDREAKKKNYQEPFKRGVAICYQIRCSIVHAGGHSVIFDKSPGADVAVLAHLAELEKVVADFLGVKAA